MNPFRTSDIAEFMGITNMGVHYLEKHGYLEADRESNGYRTYSLETLTRLGVLRSYERMGFTLNEANCLIDSSLEEVQDALDKRRARIQEQLAMVDWMQQKIKSDEMAGDAITGENSRFTIRPHMYYCPVWEEVYDMDSLGAEERRMMRDIDISWLAAMPYMEYCSKITRAEDGTIRLEKGNCIYFDHARDVLINRLTQEVCETPCLAVRSRGKEFQKVIQMAETFLKERGMEIEYPVYAPVKLFLDSKIGRKGVSEYFIPIKKPIDYKPGL